MDEIEIAQLDGVRAVMTPTAEARLKRLIITVSKNPEPTDLDALERQLHTFMATFEGRLVVVINFDGPPIVTSKPTVLAIVALLSTMDAKRAKTIKGVVVCPRDMSSRETSLATLFRSLYVARTPLEITSDVAKQTAFVERLIKREAEKRMRRTTDA